MVVSRCLPLSPVVSRPKKKSKQFFDLAIRRYNTFSGIKKISIIFTLSPGRAPTGIVRWHLDEFRTLTPRGTGPGYSLGKAWEAGD